MTTRPRKPHVQYFDRCPADNAKLECIDSRVHADHRRRRWKCPNCGVRTTTREIGEDAFSKYDETQKAAAAIEAVRQLLNDMAGPAEPGNVKET